MTNLIAAFCPKCSQILQKVTQGPNSMLNAEQFDAARLGDWFCELCPAVTPQVRYSYFWDSDLVTKPVIATHPIHSADAERKQLQLDFEVWAKENSVTAERYDGKMGRGYWGIANTIWLAYKAGRAAAQVGANGASIDCDEFWNHVIAYGKGVGKEGQALVDYINAWGRNLAAGAPAETPPTNEDFETLAESHVGHYADFAADVLERWGGWPKGVLGYGGSGVIATASAASGAPAETPKPVALTEQQVADRLCGGLIVDAAHRALINGDSVKVALPTLTRIINFFATPAATIGAGEGKDAARLDLIEKCVAENGYCYIHQNNARYEMIGLGLLGSSLRDALDALASRRAAMRSETSPGEAG